MELIPDELEKIIFHSLTRNISALESEISIAEARQIIFNSIQLIPGVRAEWASSEKFEPNTILVEYGDRIVSIPITELAEKLSNSTEFLKG